MRQPKNLRMVIQNFAGAIGRFANSSSNNHVSSANVGFLTERGHARDALRDVRVD
jgi:hypothetical protein